MRLTLIALLMTAAACRPLPEAKLRQNGWSIKRILEGDSLRIRLANPIPAPSRVEIWADALDLDSLVRQSITLAPHESTVVAFSVAQWDTTGLTEMLRARFTYGAVETPLRSDTLAFPFPRGRWYRIIQEYGGSFSHQEAFSRFALDFALAVGDTVTAAAGGVVVGVIQGYDLGGEDRKYRPYANYITLYHPQNGLFTQYVHLRHQGSFVSVGDSVFRGQPIGISGNTGFTAGPHLHFNVMAPDSLRGMVSFPAVFEEGIDGRSLKRNDRAERRVDTKAEG